MMSLTDSQVDDLRDVPLADAIKEARRRLKIKSDKLRAAANAHFDERLATIRTSTPNVVAPSLAATADAQAPDAPCDSATWNPEENGDEEMNVRRRLNDDIPKLDVTTPVDELFDGPQFFGKTPVKDISTIPPSTNLSTHMSRIYVD